MYLFYLWWTEMGSNHRHTGLQPVALPTGLPVHKLMVTRPGLEPGLYALKGHRVNQLHHRAIFGSPKGTRTLTIHRDRVAC